MTLNASTLENKITKMPETNKEIISGTKKLAVGHSIYDYWLITYAGVDPANGDALYELDPKNPYNDSGIHMNILIKPSMEKIYHFSVTCKI